MAAFAFRLAREQTGYTVASYTTKGSREALMRKPRFRQAFLDAKKRIRQMDLTYVASADPLRQALLEIYAAVALGARYNDFDTY